MEQSPNTVFSDRLDMQDVIDFIFTISLNQVLFPLTIKSIAY